MRDFKYDKNNRLLKNDNFLNSQSYIFSDKEKSDVFNYFFSSKTDGGLTILNKLFILGIIVVLFGTLFFFAFSLEANNLTIYLIFSMFSSSLFIWGILKLLLKSNIEEHCIGKKSWIVKVHPIRNISLLIEKVGFPIEIKKIKEKMGKFYIFSEDIHDIVYKTREQEILKKKNNFEKKKTDDIVQFEETDSGHKIIY